MKIKKKCFQISYPSGVKVNLGNELTPTQVKDQPTVKWAAEEGAWYTLLMTDPDAPPDRREIRHWLVVNIPFSHVSKGQTVVAFVGSAPPTMVLQRYVFLVFKQKKIIETSVFVPNTSREGRVQTSTRDLINEYQLENPKAGNFYLARYDDYVPVLQDQLGGPPPSN